jgi:hypothetical protein
MNLRPSPLTIGLLIAASVSGILLYADPWYGDEGVARLVSNKSAARRLFPNLGEHDLVQASLEFQREGGERIRLVPGSDGRHQLFVDDTLLGWADNDAVDGLWSSLRMATTLRAVAPGADVGVVQGSVEVVIGDERLILLVGEETPDGAGLYGTLVNENDAHWVIESELGAILQQPPEAWLTRRLLPVEPGSAIALEWEDRHLTRGDDGLWRVQRGIPRLLLSTSAVETRLDRLFGAEIAPLLPRETIAEGELRPWLTITEADGRQHTLRLAGECPEHPELRIVDRGPGLLGCLRSELVEPWPLADPEAGFAESQLIPYAYGRILAVEQRRPSARRLRRYGGGWVIEEVGDPALDVAEPEVYRWLSALSTTAVEMSPRELVPTVELAIESDSGTILVLRCGEAGSDWLCQRDDGPPLRLVRAAPLELAYNAETFADRRLVALEAGEARAVEILPGPRSDTVRQSARLDLGVWRLDAPAHPDGNGALDEVRLETLIATFGSLRAEAWIEVPPGATRRTLRVERAPARGNASEIALDLYPECVAHIPGHARAARISAEACAILGDDLLFIDPLRYWIGRARTIEVIEGEASTILRQSSVGTWAVDGEATGEQANRWSNELRAWDSWRSAGIRSGEPPEPARLRLRIRRVDGVTITADLGPSWLRLAGRDWYYVHDVGLSSEEREGLVPEAGDDAAATTTGG